MHQDELQLEVQLGVIHRLRRICGVRQVNLLAVPSVLFTECSKKMSEGEPWPWAYRYELGGVMSPQVVLIVAGLILVVVAILGSGDFVKVVIPTLPVWARVCLGVLGSVVFALAFIPGVGKSSSGSVASPSSSASSTPTQSTVPTTGPDSSPTSPNARTIKVVKPTSGSYVNLNNNIKVQLSGVGMSRQVWVLVQLGSQVYPQGPCDNTSLTTTVCRDVRFGDPGMHVGTPYRVTAVLVRIQDNQKYQPYIEPGFSETSPPVSPILSSSSIKVYGRE